MLDNEIKKDRIKLFDIAKNTSDQELLDYIAKLNNTTVYIEVAIICNRTVKATTLRYIALNSKSEDVRDIASEYLNLDHNENISDIKDLSEFMQRESDNVK